MPPRGPIFVTAALIAAAVLSRLSAAEAAPASPPTTEPAPVSAAASARPELNETKEQRDARMKWWREARFGMFIHWGVYSVPAGIYDTRQIPSLGEWIMYNARIPVAEYAKFPPQFNPVKFDADAWVKLARDAGMKYIVITAKHHDGFAMFHSAVDKFNIYDATPFKRDPLAELAAACKKYGLKLGFYYSQAQDWNHPGGAARVNPPAQNGLPAWPGGHWDKAQDGDMDAYLKNIAVPQVKELLTNYGDVAVLWYDTPFAFMTPERVQPFLPLHKMQPQLIINNRLSSDRNFFRGDTETPEQRIPATGYADGRDWETCMTINDTWGYKSYDVNFKPTEILLRNLVDIASKGGNYLLNVGPTAEGIIPEQEAERLLAMGQWLKVNGEAIYGTTASTFPAIPGVNVSTRQGTVTDFGQWRSTTRPGKIYLEIFKWPVEKFELSGVKGKVAKAYLLADPEKKALPIAQDGDKLAITLPAKAPDAVVSVVCLELAAGN